MMLITIHEDIRDKTPIHQRIFWFESDYPLFKRMNI